MFGISLGIILMNQAEPRDMNSPRQCITGYSVVLHPHQRQAQLQYPQIILVAEAVLTYSGTAVQSIQAGTGFPGMTGNGKLNGGPRERNRVRPATGVFGKTWAPVRAERLIRQQNLLQHRLALLTYPNRLPRSRTNPPISTNPSVAGSGMTDGGSGGAVPVPQ